MWGTQTDDCIQPGEGKHRATLRAVFLRLGLAGPKSTQASPSPNVHSFGQQISCKANIKHEEEILKKLACLCLNNTSH